MVSDTMWALALLGFSLAGSVGFVLLDFRCQRRDRQVFRRELDELREFYRGRE